MGVIYVVWHVLLGYFYVGQTIDDPMVRMQQHLTDAMSLVRESRANPVTDRFHTHMAHVNRKQVEQELHKEEEQQAAMDCQPKRKKTKTVERVKRTSVKDPMINFADRAGSSSSRKRSRNFDLDLNLSRPNQPQPQPGAVAVEGKADPMKAMAAGFRMTLVEQVPRGNGWATATGAVRQKAFKENADKLENNWIFRLNTMDETYGWNSKWNGKRVHQQTVYRRTRKLMDKVQKERENEYRRGRGQTSKYYEEHGQKDISWNWERRVIIFLQKYRANRVRWRDYKVMTLAKIYHFLQFTVSAPWAACYLIPVGWGVGSQAEEGLPGRKVYRKMMLRIRYHLFNRGWITELEAKQKETKPMMILPLTRKSFERWPNIVKNCFRHTRALLPEEL